MVYTNITPKLYALLWGPAEALLNFNYASSDSLLISKLYHPYDTWQKTLFFPKGEFLKELYRGFPLVEWLSLPLLWFHTFITPTTHEKKPVIVWVVGWLGGGYLPFLSLIFEKWPVFFSFFLMCLAIRGNDFNFFFSTSKPKIELVERKWTQKSTLLANLTPVIWPFWGSKKSFSGLFRSFFGVV